MLECLGAGIPFVAAEVGGIPELVAEEDRPCVLFPRSAKGLAAALRRALEEGVRPARPRLPFAEVERRWLAWQDSLAPVPAPLRNAPPESPRVSVCMATHNRPETLAMAIASVEAQTYPNLELVLVDDCSTRPEARAYLDALEPRFAERGWTLLRNAENLYHGAARSRAVDAASGAFVLFMDDDNAAFPDQVETLVRAAEASGADIVVAQQQSFEGPGEPPRQRSRAPMGWVPVGACAGLGVFENGLGDANMLIRRAALERLGGLTLDRCGFEDWEILQRAALAGLRVECLPEVLACYRIWGHASTSAPDPRWLFASYARALRPALAAVPPQLRPALEFAMQAHLAHKQRNREGYWARGPARSAADQALAEHAPNSPDAFVAAAELAMGGGQREAARALAEQALRLSPHHGPARRLLEAIG